LNRLDMEKEKLLTQLLRFLVLIGGLAYVPSMAAAIVNRLYLIAVVDTVMYLLVIYIAWNRRIKARSRIFVLVYCSFIVGVVVLFLTGPDGAGYIWFICAIVLSALFASKPLVIVQLVLACVALTVYALGLWLGFIDHAYEVWAVMVIASNLLVVAMLLAFLTYRMLKTMDAAYREQAALANQLAAELVESRRFQAELTKLLDYKDDLMRELHHRVKNNLQSINSLLNLEGEELGGPSGAANPADLLNALQRRLYVLSAVNDLFLENAHTDLIGVGRLLDAINFYCVESDASAPFVCSVGAGAEEVWFSPQDAAIAGLAVAEILYQLRFFYQACLIDVRQNGAIRVLEFWQLKEAGGPSVSLEGLTALFAANAVLKRFFGPLYCTWDEADGLRVQLDISGLIKSAG